MTSASASAFLKLSPQEVVTDEWEVLDDPGTFGFDDIIATLLGLLFFLIPGVIVLFVATTRPSRRGYLCLTNWRCLYYERGEGTFRNYHRISSADLSDIVGVHSTYKEGFMGKRSLTISLTTKHDDAIGIQIDDSGVWLAKLPLVGRLFRRNSLGRDATKVSPLLFTLIEERRGETAGSQMSY